MTTKERIFVVCEGASSPQFGTAGVSAGLSFHFETGLRQLRAVEVPEHALPAQVHFAVPEETREIRADFRQQILNLPFMDLLTRTRPTSVRVESLAGCTLDLPRLTVLLRIPTTVVLPPIELLPAPEGRQATWLRDALASATELEFPSGVTDDTPYAAFTGRRIHPHGKAPRTALSTGSNTGFDYSLYEFGFRDHALLWQMQQPYVRFFKPCSQVLDVGCGAGIFLGLLQESGIAARGIDRNPGIVRYACGLGFDVEQGDALDVLQHSPAAYDGIYCSHFVEHLTIDSVERLLALLSRALMPGGRVVLVFPDPESIRSQLLGFWRDPEHVRFYHPDLIEMMSRAIGLDCIWHSHRDGPRREITGFPAMARVDQMDAAPPIAPLPPPRSTIGHSNRPWARWLRRLGLAPANRLLELEQQEQDLSKQVATLRDSLIHVQRQLSLVQADTSQLWKVNQTWSWEDNAVLVLQKNED